MSDVIKYHVFQNNGRTYIKDDAYGKSKDERNLKTITKPDFFYFRDPFSGVDIPPYVSVMSDLNSKMFITIAATESKVFAVTRDQNLLAASMDLTLDDPNEAMFNEPKHLPKDVKWNYVSCGSNFCVACGRVLSGVKSETGVVYSWGINTANQLGRKAGEKSDFGKVEFYTQAPHFNKVGCGRSYTLLLAENSDIWSFDKIL